MSSVKDIAASMSDLLQHSNKNFGKPKDSEEMKEMKTKARVVVENTDHSNHLMLDLLFRML